MEGLLAAADEDSGGSDYEELGLGGAYAAELPPDPGPASGGPDLDPDDGRLTVRVSGFRPQGNKMVYTVESSTSLPAFQKKRMKVFRKFEDFSWLCALPPRALLAAPSPFVSVARLEENDDLAGVLIPPLPGKVVWTDPDPTLADQQLEDGEAPEGADGVKVTDPFQKRAAELQRFLGYIARHQQLREDDHVVFFLGYPDEVRPAKERSWLGGLFSKAASMVEPTLRETAEPWATHWAWAENYTACAGYAAEQGHAMCHFARALGRGERRVTDQLLEYIEVCAERDGPGLAKVLHIFAAGMTQSNTLNHMRAEVNEQAANIAGDYAGIASSTRSLLERRLRAQIRVGQQNSDIQAVDSAAVPADQDKKQALRDKRKRLVHEREGLVGRADAINDTAQREIALARRRRAADLARTMRCLAENEIEQARLRAASWAALRDKLGLALDSA